MQLGHLLTRSGLTYPEVSSNVYHDSFCQMGNRVSLPWVIITHHHHHHHICVMQSGHLLTRSGLTYPEVSSEVCHDSFCQSDSSVSLPWVIITHHHHHHISVMQSGHMLTRSCLTYPEVSSEVCHDSFCQSESSVSLPWVIYFEAFYLHVVSTSLFKSLP